MKKNLSTKSRQPRDLNLGVIIIFIVVTVVFAISLYQSSLGQELFKSKELVKIGRR